MAFTWNLGFPQRWKRVLLEADNLSAQGDVLVMGWHPYRHSCLSLLRTSKAWLWTVGRGWTTLRCTACLAWTCVWPLLKYWPVKSKLALTSRPFYVHHEDIYRDENWHMGECQPRSQQPCFQLLGNQEVSFWASSSASWYIKMSIEGNWENREWACTWKPGPLQVI